MILDVDIDVKMARLITVDFSEDKPRYTITLYDGGHAMVIPITRAQMLNIIDDVGRAKKNA